MIVHKPFKIPFRSLFAACDFKAKESITILGSINPNPNADFYAKNSFLGKLSPNLIFLIISNSKIFLSSSHLFLLKITIPHPNNTFGNM